MLGWMLVGTALGVWVALALFNLGIERGWSAILSQLTTTAAVLCGLCGLTLILSNRVFPPRSKEPGLPRRSDSVRVVFYGDRPQERESA